MKKGIALGFVAVAILVGTGLLLSTNPANEVKAQIPCPWNPGDPDKMHYPQLPDETGYDVNATFPSSAADDWECSETGPVKDIHFWGSWRGGNTGVIQQFILNIYTDIPAVQSPTGYSMPGTVLWTFETSDFEIIGIDPPSQEHWYDPAVPETLWNDHQAYFQYNVCLPEALWFDQVAGTIYWLEISAIVQDPAAYHWGWKTSVEHFNDDAVWRETNQMDWMELIEPTPALLDRYWGIFDPAGILVAGGSGTAYAEMWFEYEEWWNIWWYDHPYDPDRYKNIALSIGGIQLDPQYPSYLVVAANWSTDAWSLLDPPPDHPPLPPTNEELYIGRAYLDSIILTGTFGGEPVWRGYELVIPDYNPEWVSVDVRGSNAEILEPMSVIAHQCTKSLDLAFVITGGEDELGACCFDDPTGLGPTCGVMSLPDCNSLGGMWLGPGTTCSNVQACCMQDGSCFDIDSVCCEDAFGGIPQGPGTSCSPPEACCMPDGSCFDLDPLCCITQGGNPQGPGTACQPPVTCCMPDGSCRMLDPLCCVDQGGQPIVGAPPCTVPEACCMPDGSCRMMDPVCCIDAGGDPQGTGSVCTAPEACCMPDGSCRMMDPLCCADLGGHPQGQGSVCTEPEACCLPDGSCENLDPLCCIDRDGNPQGPGSICTAPRACCLSDGSCEDLDPLCCLYIGGEPAEPGVLCGGQIMACCFQDNTCQNLDPACCALYGGDPVAGTLCQGDNNQNGIDDACETEYCCGMYDPENRTGNVDQDPANVKDLTDILMLANYAFLGGVAPPCLADGNVDGIVIVPPLPADPYCILDLTDILALANYSYLGGPLPAYCDPRCE